MIGGEFEIRIDDLSDLTRNAEKSFPDFYKYSSGRAALYHILSYLRKEKKIYKIMIPDYLCPSIVRTINIMDYDIIFYPLNNLLQIEKNKFATLYEKGCAILLINYFGIIKIFDQIDYIKSIDCNAVIIEDDVQSFYSFMNEDHDVDFQFSSLRKTFAIPDGGLVKSKHTLKEATQENFFSQYKVSGGILKSLRNLNLFDDDVYLGLLEQGEALIDSDLFSSMSKMAEHLYLKTDFEQVRNIRKENADYLLKGLNELGISSIFIPDEDSVPLFIPLLIEDRNRIRKKMFEHQIFCPVHWPLEGLNLVTGKKMQENELSLIVDQRYNTKDMDLILSMMENVRNVV